MGHPSSSTKSYLKDPVAKIDFSILDGTHALWPQLVSPIELTFNIGSGPKCDHLEAIGQLSDRFGRIFDKQPRWQFVVGAIASGTEIEFAWMDKLFNYKRSGPIKLEFTNEGSPGVNMLLDMATAPKECIGCLPFDREKDLVQTIDAIKYKALIEYKTSPKPNPRITFVALGILEEEDVVIKASTNEHEHVILQKLASLQVQNMPNVCLSGQFDNSLR